MADPVRLGMIGVGRWSGMLAEAAARTGAIDLVSCFARSEASRAEFGERYGARPAASLEELLGDDIDGVVVATPHSTHADLIVAAAAAGKHVFVDKPFTLTVDEGQRAIDAARDAGVILQVGHQRRKQAATRAIRDLIDAGELGQVQLLEANLSQPSGMAARPGWRNDTDEAPLGGMTSLGVHMADNLHFLGGPVERVSVFSRQVLGATATDDVTTYVLEFHSGALGYLGTSRTIPKICVTGVYGTQSSAWSEEEGTRLYRQGIDETTRTEVAIEPADEMAVQLAEYADCIRDGSTPEITGEVALEVVAILEAGMISHAQSRAVELAEVRERRS